MSALLEGLRELPPGRNGFESLVAALLSRLTGRRFYLARSGYQGGRDFASDRDHGTVIVVECKRYASDTDLDSRELLGEVEQAHQAIPDLDLWVLATSRTVADQVITPLRRSCEEKGIALEVLSAVEIPVLCAFDHDLVLTFLTANVEAVQSELLNLRHASDYAIRLEDIRRRFLHCRIGYDQYAAAQNTWLLDCLRDEARSRASFQSRLPNPQRPPTQIRRAAVTDALDSWYASWSVTHAPFLLLGKEGVGKTWAAVSWLIHRISASERFPPVVVVRSYLAASDEPGEVVARAIEQQIHGAHVDWRRRIRRWLSRDDDSPTLLVVLDGINERRPPRGWPALLEGCLSSPWGNRVAMILTCRTIHWQRELADLVHAPMTQCVMDAYSDSEFDEALAVRGLSRNDVPHELRPIVRHPRYFEVFVRHAAAIADSGDPTIVRLYYEDFRDRRARCEPLQQLDNDDFNDLLRQLAKRCRTPEAVVSMRELGEYLPHLPDVPTVLTELATGGVFVKRGLRVTLSEPHSQLGLGLLLADAAGASSSTSESEEIIAAWLGADDLSDFQQQVLAFAILHASTMIDYPANACAALILAAFGIGNRGRSNITAYLRLRPDAYRIATEAIYAQYRNPHAEDELIYAWITCHSTPSVGACLSQSIQDWLGHIHVAGGLAPPRDEQNAIARARRNLSQHLGRDVKPGPLTYCDRRFTVVEDEGLLRLPSLALTLVSHLPREEYLPAIVTGVLAEEIMGRPSNCELFRWVLRTWRQSAFQPLSKLVNDLLISEDRTALRAAARLFEYEGSEEAIRASDRLLPTGLFEPGIFASRQGEDPCRSPFGVSQEDCGRCLERPDIPIHRRVQMAHRYVADPSFRVPNHFVTEIKSVAATFDAPSIWCHEMNTSRDHEFEQLEPVLCAFAPTILAAAVRAFACSASTRSIAHLRHLAFSLESRSLCLDDASINALLAARRRADESDDRPGAEVVEQVLMSSLLIVLPAERQLELVLSRRSDYCQPIWDSLFKPLVDFTVSRAELETLLETRRLRQLCWFLSSHPDTCPPDILSALTRQRWMGDSSTRGFVYKLLYYNGTVERTLSHMDSGGKECDLEVHWKNLLLAKTVGEFDQLVESVPPSFLGHIVEVRGSVRAEVDYLAKHLDGALSRTPGNGAGQYGDWLARTYGGAGLSDVVKARPDLVDRWLSAGRVGEAESHRRVPVYFLQTLCTVLLKLLPEKGVEAYRQMAALRPATLPTADLFACEPLPAVAEEWSRIYDAASTDGDLLHLGTVAWRGASRDWLVARIHSDLQSPVMYERARAVSLLGFVNSGDADGLLQDIQRSSLHQWLTDVAKDAVKQRRANDNARYWFERFLIAETKEEALCAFHLFARCADSRYFGWRSDLRAEIKSLDHARSAFLIQRGSDIRKRIEGHLKKLEGTFLGSRVVRMAWPWLRLV